MDAIWARKKKPFPRIFVCRNDPLTVQFLAILANILFRQLWIEIEQQERGNWKDGCMTSRNEKASLILIAIIEMIF